MKKRNVTALLSIVFLFISLQMSFGQGARYTGTYKKSAPIQHNGVSNIVIEGVEISSENSYAIVLYNSQNVTIRNSKFGPTPLKTAIYLYNCKNITIIDNTFNDVQSALVASTSQGIKFEYNDVTNVVGKLRGAKEVGVLAQFIQVTGAGNSVSYNVNENFPGQSDPEDLININQSSGTAQSPIVVKGNWIRGGGPSVSGGGINLGDLNGAYQVAEDNILVNPGQYGIAISGGHDMALKNNTVYAKRDNFTNVGLIAVNWYEGQAYNITVGGNKINYTNKDGAQNSWWIYQNVEPVAGKSTNEYRPDITESILPKQIIGRARNGVVTPPPTTQPEPDPTPEPEPTPGQDPTPNPGVDDGSKIVNHPSIRVYKDRFNRVCILNIGSIYPGATVTATVKSHNLAHTQRLTGYHTAINYTVPSGMVVDVVVKNGNRMNYTQLSF